MESESTLHHHYPIEAPKSLDYFPLCDEHCTNSEADHNAALDKALQVMHNNAHNLLRAVNYKHCTG